MWAFVGPASRFPGDAEVTSESRSFEEASAIRSTASSNAASFTAEGFWNPLILRTYWSAAARISSPVAGASKLCNLLMFLHICKPPGPG